MVSGQLKTSLWKQIVSPMSNHQEKIKLVYYCRWMDRKEAVSFLFTHGRGVHIKDRGGTSRDYLIHSNFIDMGTEGHVR